VEGHPRHSSKGDVLLRYLLVADFGFVQEFFDFIEGNNWGDYHQIWHSSRLFLMMPEEVRQWMTKNS
jgi:hypothetical protein